MILTRGAIRRNKELSRQYQGCVEARNHPINYCHKGSMAQRITKYYFKPLVIEGTKQENRTIYLIAFLINRRRLNQVLHPLLRVFCQNRNDPQIYLLKGSPPPESSL
jgi:hypothetical protein